MQTEHSPVEPMHALKVVAEHITKLLNGDEDGCKVRAQERSDNRFVSSCPNEAFTIYATRHARNSSIWMFPYERFNKTLSQCITNTRNPELNAVKKMEVHWLLTMLECAGYLEQQTRTNFDQSD
ncbi:uncharacterized protein [Argopecten irradians]|uniref:uncharacterized protein n=1 Tax=Argopecten irradians TaxID=31199 RepID=UPI003716ADF6